MKLTILISILLTTYLNAATQIVIGTFSKSFSAENTKNSLNKVLNSDPVLKNILDKNNIKSVIKQDGKYFIVTLEPLLNKTVQDEVLNKIKSTRFKDAYILKLDMPKSEVVSEAKTIEPKEIVVKPVKQPEIKAKEVQEVKRVEEIPQEEITAVVVKEKPIKKQIKKPQDIKSENNFVENYMMEIIAFIVVLILIVIYMFILKNKHKKSVDDSEDIIIVDHNQEKDENLDEILEQEAQEQIIQEKKLEEEQEKEEQEAEESVTQEIDPLRSSIEKKEIPQHGKISKENFKEFDGMRVMIAEDNLINQKVIKGLLAESGIQLTIVDDGQEVISHLEKDDAFCMILMDVNMPHMDGFEATKIIRANPKYSHITVIALSGDVAADDIANMHAAGMQENLEKPLKMDDLYDILYGYGYHREDKIDIQSSNTSTSTKNELDIQSGIEVCGGDEDFYKEILRDFLSTYEGSVKKIQNYLNNNDIDSTQKILLDITGVTANIGASNIQELLSKLKQELKNPDDKVYIDTFKLYAQHFNALEKEVKEYLS